MIRSGTYRAQSDEEKEAVYRFRYDVYVEEMGRYRSIADHDRRMLFEPEDDTGRIFLAAQDGVVVATARMSWGGDAPFSERQVESYRIAPFLDELPRDVIVVGERGMVAPELRGSDVFTRLRGESSAFMTEKRIQLLFGACEPHLLSLYIGQGARTFSRQNINSPESGYLIPIVTVLEDYEYLRSIGAPGLETTVDHGADSRVPECVERLITHGGNVISHRLTASGSYWREVQVTIDQLADNRISALEGLTEEEAGRCLGQSNIIECKAGDRVLKKGGVARNMFVVLEGALEARDGDKLLRVMTTGDICGEVAFLLEQARSADVYAATDCRILSLSESTIRRVIGTDPDVAANLMLNVAKILCMRMLERN